MSLVKNKEFQKPLIQFFAAALLVFQVGCGGGGSGDQTEHTPPKLKPVFPTDPLLKYQWHLKNTGQTGAPDSTLYGAAGVDLNVWPVWTQGFSGKGITVSVVDGGLEIGHEDLQPNMADGLSYDYSNDSADPVPISSKDEHGTQVAGVIAAAMNTTGGVGVAPEARLAGLKIFNANDQPVPPSIFQEALSRGADDGSIDISNNSWGPSIRGTVGGVRIGTAVRAAAQHGADYGRNGRGIVYLFAAGNDCLGHNCPMPGYGLANFDLMREPELMAICAIDAEGRHPGYSSPGSNLLVCAPSSSYQSTLPGITTTTLSNQYTHKFGGTSAAAPMVSGVVALMLQANPELTWRDVRLILARTARIFDGMKTDHGTDARIQWIQTKAINPYTGQPYKYSVLYGFGAVNAEAAVKYARNFKSVGGSSRAWRERACVNEVEPAQSTTQIQMSCADQKVEFVEIEIGLVHPRFRDLAVTLTSPSGTQVPLTQSHPICGTAPEYTCSTSDFGNVYHTSVTALLDEPAGGNWSVQVADKGNSRTRNIVRRVKLVLR